MRISANQQRAQALSALSREVYDLLVIGGGVTGCGIARDAALRGFNVALVEKNDFAAGTSSKSSKLIHGGLRYLEQAEFKLVFEGTTERAVLMRTAPHLVRPLPFLVPAYRGRGRSLLELRIGLWMYDALSKFSSPKLHKTYGTQKILELEPLLRPESLTGGVVYYDCMTDDARVTLENALAARACGATVLNHVRAERLLVDADGRISGAEVVSTDPGDYATSAIVRARVVVNATGPWSDQLRHLVGERPILRPTKGVHLVVDAARLPVRHAIVILARDGRVMFAIPWGGERTVIGTTDTFFDGSPDRVYANADDVSYLLAAVNRYYPSAALCPDDVLATWAGLRPLLSPDSGSEAASDVSREHEIIERPGFVTIAGGKLTTHRRMAAEVVDAVGLQLGQVPASSTKHTPLPGAVGIDGTNGVDALAAELVVRGHTDGLAQRWAHVYGGRSRALSARVSESPALSQPLDPEQPYLLVEVDEAVDVEGARTLIDVLARRVPLILRARDQGLGIAPLVAEHMARLLDWTPARAREEVDRYVALVDETRLFRRA